MARSAPASAQEIDLDFDAPDLDGAEDGGSAGGPRRWVLRVLLGVGLLALVVTLGFALAAFIGSGGSDRPTVQQIALVRPPEPPPPPPKPPEKPPEPPKIKEEIKVDEAKPEPKPDQPKPADDKPASDKPLGVDAAGTAGSDGFGLAANRGGRDLIGTGSGGDLVRYYSGLLQRNFYEALAHNRKLPQDAFTAVVSVWLGSDGRVRRTEILSSSGDPSTDRLIQSTLAAMAPLVDVPPENLRVVRLRLDRSA